MAKIGLGYEILPSFRALAVEQTSDWLRRREHTLRELLVQCARERRAAAQRVLYFEKRAAGYSTHLREVLKAQECTSMCHIDETKKRKGRSSR